MKNEHTKKPKPGSDVVMPSATSTGQKTEILTTTTIIRRATDADLIYLWSLQDKNNVAVGFLPHLAFREYLARNQIQIATENSDPCGYLLHREHTSPRPTRYHDEIRIIQACIQYDARRVAHATTLVNNLIAHATATGHTRISLWCASDLDANTFWANMGFSNVQTRIGGYARKKNGRTHNRWIKDLPNPKQIQLF